VAALPKAEVLTHCAAIALRPPTIKAAAIASLAVTTYVKIDNISQCTAFVT
jgi:hypothetical protein